MLFYTTFLETIRRDAVNTMEPDVLLLNANHQPLKVIDYRRAVMLYLEGKVYILEKYADRVIRSMSRAIPWPAVVVLKRFVSARSKVNFRRKNVLARDNYTCQYCGLKPITMSGLPDGTLLTMDHVVPRSRGQRGRVTLPWNGKSVPVTGWENIVTCCGPCNNHKGNKTPDEAGMKLMAIPCRPRPVDILNIVTRRSKVHVPEEWMNHVEFSS